MIFGIVIVCWIFICLYIRIKSYRKRKPVIAGMILIIMITKVRNFLHVHIVFEYKILKLEFFLFKT